MESDAVEWCRLSLQICNELDCLMVHLKKISRTQNDGRSCCKEYLGILSTLIVCKNGCVLLLLEGIILVQDVFSMFCGICEGSGKDYAWCASATEWLLTKLCTGSN